MGGQGWAACGTKPVAWAAVLRSRALSGHQRTGPEHKPEAAVIPRPSLPSPFPGHICEGQDFGFSRTKGDRGCEPLPPCGSRREAPPGECQGLPGWGPLLGLTIPPQEAGIISLASSGKHRSPQEGEGQNSRALQTSWRMRFLIFALMPPPEAGWVRGRGRGVPLPSKCRECAQHSRDHLGMPGSVPGLQRRGDG